MQLQGFSQRLASGTQTEALRGAACRAQSRVLPSRPRAGASVEAPGHNIREDAHNRGERLLSGMAAWGRACLLAAACARQAEAAATAAVTQRASASGLPACRRPAHQTATTGGRQGLRGPVLLALPSPHLTPPPVSAPLSQRTCPAPTPSTRATCPSSRCSLATASVSSTAWTRCCTARR